MREQVIQMVEEEKIIAIVRGIDAEKCMKVADALYEGGIRLMEITFDQKNPDSFPVTANAIAEIGAKYQGRMLVGAGTVTTPELVELAAKAGAKYIISPDVNVEVIRRTRELGLVSMPGAMTPSEVMTAHNAGADYVKLLAVGGSIEKNVADYMAAGMCGAGVGGNLANKKWIEAGEFHKITETARELLAAAKSVK